MGAPWIVVALCASACGRIGFDASSGGGGDGGGGSDGGGIDPRMIEITVLGEENTPIEGQPIANATVVFVGDDVQIRATDSAGIARAMVLGPTTVHVAHRRQTTGPTWRYFTLADVPGGTALSVGYTPETTIAEIVSLSVTVPGYPATASYRLVGPLRCNVSGGGSGVQIGAVITGCAGESIPVVALAYDEGTGQDLASLDAGSIVVTEGASYAPNGTWQPLVVERVQYPGLPSSVAAGALLTSDAGGERFVLGESPAFDIAGEHVDVIDAIDRPIELVTVGYKGVGATSFEGVAAELPPPPVGGVRSVDTSRLVKLVETRAPTARGVTWTYLALPRSPTIVFARLFYMTSAGETVDWSLVVPGDATSMDVPVVPALDELVPATAADGGFLVYARDPIDYATLLVELFGPSRSITLELEAMTPGTAFGVTDFTNIP